MFVLKMDEIYFVAKRCMKVDAHYIRMKNMESFVIIFRRNINPNNFLSGLAMYDLLCGELLVHLLTQAMYMVKLNSIH